MKKLCVECEQYKNISFFSKKNIKCKKCNKKIYYSLYYKKLYKDKPWSLTLKNIKKRCNTVTCIKYPRYGGRGIKCLITAEELKTLWFRDKAYEMKKPSIDRIDNDGDYCFENCRYIELTDNIIKRNKELKRKYRR
jgi:hypothetical protein